MDILTEKLPGKSLTLLVVCLGGLLLFVLAGIVPMQISIVRMEEQIRNAAHAIAEQRDFAPVYEAFVARISKAATKTDSALILPKPAKLAREQVPHLNHMMRDIATRAGMTTVSVSPLLNTAEMIESVAVSHHMQGNYGDFRKYLLYVAQLPYFEKIDSIVIEGTSNNLGFAVKLRLTVA